MTLNSCWSVVLADDTSLERAHNAQAQQLKDSEMLYVCPVKMSCLTRMLIGHLAIVYRETPTHSWPDSWLMHDAVLER